MPPASPSPAFDAAALACPVRGCSRGLALAGRTLRCAAGHSFDLSRRGAVNLLQPQDKRAREPGDARGAVEARARVLGRGLGAPLLAALLELARKQLSTDHPIVLDVGCGTGWFLAQIAARPPVAGYGVDLSAAAIERAARDHPGLAWIVANADRRLPFRDASIDLALSITGPKNAAELRRVLRGTGRLAVAVPAADDLVELRAAVLGEGRSVERADKALALLAGPFELEERRSVTSRARLGPEALRDLLASTYRGGRRAREARAGELEALDLTLGYELLWLRPSGSAP